MGYIRHHGIIVTSFDEKSILAAHQQAEKIFTDYMTFERYPKFKMVSEILKSPVNGYCTFFIGPDGSKEGWNESKQGDEARREFIQFLIDRKEEIYTQWAEVRYQDDENRVEIEQHSIS